MGFSPLGRPGILLCGQLEMAALPSEESRSGSLWRSQRTIHNDQLRKTRRPARLRRCKDERERLDASTDCRRPVSSTRWNETHEV